MFRFGRDDSLVAGAAASDERMVGIGMNLLCSIRLTGVRAP